MLPPVPIVRASVDPQLRARIVRRHALHYTPAVQRADHPGFVRAASGLVWFQGRLAIVQDDTLLVALVDADTLQVEALDLPLRADGARSFDVERGNKKDKPDFEACLSLQHQGRALLLAFGSGSHANRESIALVSQREGQFESRIVPVPAFYAALRASPDLLSTELNLEGAVTLGDTLRLFQRSNGALLAPGSTPTCATCDLSLSALLAHLDAPTRAPVPALRNVTHYELGQAGSGRLTFTDATTLPDTTILFSASAESSPNAYDDGEVTGSALGILRDAKAQLCLLQDEQGQPLRDKVEGVALASPANLTRAYVVIDPDDHHKPGTLAEVELTGF
jgi:hypothetical protein